MTSVIDLSIREKLYKKKKVQLSILNDFKLEVKAGEKIAIVGESGVGKSSLLNIIGLLDKDYSGEYTLFGSQVNTLPAGLLARWRNEKISCPTADNRPIRRSFARRRGRMRAR